MEENTYVGITLVSGFYVNDTYRQDRLGGLLVIVPARELETRVRILAQASIFSLKLLIYDLPDDYSES